MAAHCPSVDPVGRTALVIRAATTGDVPAVDAIEQACFGDPWPSSAFGDAVRNGGLLFLVAAEGSAVVGYVIAWFAADEGEIANIAVAPACRGRGIGKALLDAALAQGRERRARAVYLEVRESNVAARALYASRRFEEVGRRRGYYRRPVEDAIVLRRLE